MDIYVEKIGEWVGCYREYYRNILTKSIYAKIDYNGMVGWYTCDRNGGEPDLPLRSDLEIKIVNHKYKKYNNEGEDIT